VREFSITTDSQNLSKKQIRWTKWGSKIRCCARFEGIGNEFFDLDLFICSADSGLDLDSTKRSQGALMFYSSLKTLYLTGEK
jgi:hypothetical protein